MPCHTCGELTKNVRTKIKARARTFADDNFLMPNASIYLVVENAMFEGATMALEEVPALIRNEEVEPGPSGLPANY